MSLCMAKKTPDCAPNKWITMSVRVLCNGQITNYKSGKPSPTTFTLLEKRRRRKASLTFHDAFCQVIMYWKTMCGCKRFRICTFFLLKIWTVTTICSSVYNWTKLISMLHGCKEERRLTSLVTLDQHVKSAVGSVVWNTLGSYCSKICLTALEGSNPN